MAECLIVGAGGAVGAVLRYLIGLIPLNPENGFPIKTFLINVAGCFVIGLVAALAARASLNPRITLFLKVGICGGFTTFSSFALETEQLMAKGAVWMAVSYVAASVLCGILAVFAAQKLL
ncbi:MAG TPA: fluoride efflux transporter CrcB [Candidatus Pullilachnospira stercoravium]|uniref:Fluoride-specific ion channel FluC n=1 Tax=Candidatus Pullilachnospira stercoravium TaxID=2840913 RepID=A0A9D1NSI9_9FIRM|nr:fluoride efflux transporter CrcB [Candidatus Pullilachnospira stercoravium]